ncbi:TetR/AcrR family transcriptional regulator [Indiicoccus explosivorum]|uniref:TetR/AcrR family transcriptional regulator n=1 Tax=Indiicoccus explosivorum TaxID=1917864 RepID=UPI000B433F27|nr:TetR/AcrR family transcriptional regulator [Indiicoccus explosivorum]
MAIEDKKKSSPQRERTKRELKQSFIELIGEKGYSHVTVTDIVKRAAYNRATFYLYYFDKSDITEDLRSEMFEKIKHTSMERYPEERTVLTRRMGTDSFDLLTFVYDNRSFFNLYLKEDTIPGLHHDLPRAIYELLEKMFTFTAVGEHDLNTPKFKLYMAHGTAGLILEWVESGYEDSPAEVTKQLIRILQSFAKGFTISRKRLSGEE